MAIIAAVTTFADEPSAWLDYLAHRTRWTLGARCAAAHTVALGNFEATTNTLTTPELIKPAPNPESKTGSEAGPIELDLPRPAGTATPTRFPLPADGDRTLAFLAERTAAGRHPPLNAADALVPEWSTTSLDADAKVARWYAGLPTDPATRAQALATAARRDGAAEQPSAIRAIADEALDQATPALLETSTTNTTTPTAAILAAVSLWLLGHRQESTEAFNAVVSHTGAAEFRSLWQVKPSDNDPSTLFGPDPDGWSST